VRWCPVRCVPGRGDVGRGDSTAVNVRDALVSTCVIEADSDSGSDRRANPSTVPESVPGTLHPADNPPGGLGVGARDAVRGWH
jgi:hypothetical protein